MKRLLALSLMLMLLIAAGCAGQSSAVPSPSNVELSASDSAPSTNSETNSLSAAPQASVSEAPSSAVGTSEPGELPLSAEKGALTGGQTLEKVTKAVFEDEERFMSSKPATKSWPKAYESFYDAYPTLAEFKQLKGLGDLALRDQFAYTLWSIEPASISEVYCNLADSPSPPSNLFSKFFMKEQGEIGILLNYAGTDDYFGEATVSLSTLPSESGKEIAYINIDSVKRFDVGRYRHRTSMTMTAGIEAQLLEQGFSPETTIAYALTIPSYAHGVCFIDGERISFYVAGDSLETPQSMRLGVVYPFMLIAQDIHDRIDEIAPEPEPRPEPLLGEIANPSTAKPVIYLYPERPTDISVTLSYPEEELTYTYPAYDGGWQVRAEPDGTLTNLKDGSTHYYLFWEGDKKVDWDLSRGFVIKGSETEAFLREKLSFMGLTPREYNDFITYWAPEMSRNPYNLISFSTEQYEALAPLSFSPVPDSMLRVHMVYKGLQQPVKVLPQTLIPWQRTGFAAVEWGGSRA